MSADKTTRAQDRKPGDTARAARLKAALKANIAKRKAQAKGRAQAVEHEQEPPDQTKA